MNQFCLVGRVTQIPQLQTSAQGWKTCQVQLEVSRPFANAKGEFEKDLISLEVWRGAAETLSACATPETWISARGRIQSRQVEKEGKTYTNYSMVAEKIEYIR